MPCEVHPVYGDRPLKVRRRRLEKDTRKKHALKGKRLFHTSQLHSDTNRYPTDDVWCIYPSCSTVVKKKIENTLVTSVIRVFVPRESDPYKTVSPLRRSRRSLRCFCFLRSKGYEQEGPKTNTSCIGMWNMCVCISDRKKYLFFFNRK